MKKSIKILISLLLICTIMLPNGVRADSDHNIYANNFDRSPTGYKNDGKEYVGSMPEGIFKGVRITLVDNNGNRQSNPIDFFCPTTRNKDWTLMSHFSEQRTIKEVYNDSSHFIFKSVKYTKLSGMGINIDWDASRKYFSSQLCNAKIDWGPVVEKIRALSDGINKNDTDSKNFFNLFGKEFDKSKVVNWYYMVEPVLVIAINESDGTRICTAYGTSAELTENFTTLLGYQTNPNFDKNVPCYNPSRFHDRKMLNWYKNNYIYYAKGAGGQTIFGKGDLKSTFYDNFSDGNYFGLIWLGKNAIDTQESCSKYADDKSIWVAGWKYDPDKANDKVASNPNNNTIRSTCGLAPTPCHNYANDKSIWTDGWEYAAKNAYLNVPHGSDKDEIRKKCGSAPIPCSDYKDKNTTIWIDGWVYDSNKAINKIAADAANNTDTIRKTCGYQITCETDDIYNKSTDFTDVQLTPNASRNCCLALEKKYANDKNKLNELYRDHNECYECKYDPTKIKPTCSTGDNKKTTGYTFTRDVGNATVTADTYTCISWAVDGKNKNVSKNLFTKKEINEYCKVICSETVTLEFPFFNNGNSVRYVTKNSIFAWPKKNNSDEDELKLKASGKLTCWYRVNLVGLYNLFSSDKNGAVGVFNQCKNDMNKSLTTPENILPNSYNLSGSFKVKTDDDPNYVSLAKENGTNSVSYTKQTSSAEITLSATKGNVSSLVRAAEKLKFEVTENANFVISNTGKDAGYSYSYDGKYYRSKTDVGISNIKSNNIIKFEPSLKFNEKTGSGNVSIIYSNIGGSSPKFIENEQTYENKDESGLKNHRCVYKKINNGKEYLCPDETKNRGMNLKNYMTTESLTYDEAVEKYCNESNNMTVCPSDSYYPNKAITKSCYNDETCLKLTCYRYTCTDDDGCHELNDCIEKTIKDYNMSFDDAKKVCTNNNCNEKVGNSGNIEYRVIDLKDPFPGNAAKAGSSSFNTNIKGRKPGSNWNSTTIVKKEILNNRGVSGDAIYNLEPLYEFNLTPSVIKSIRNYNDEHSYDDFTLSCKGNNKQACVASGFDFRKNYGIVKAIEQCKGISDLSEFNSCYNNDSLR